MLGRLLDRLVGVVSPRRGLEGSLSRDVGRDAVRSFQAAGRSRRTEGWRATRAGANLELAGALPVLRDRSRDLIRNSPHGKSGLERFATDLVGNGIVPRAVTSDEEFNKDLNAAFQEWSRQCDPEGQLDFFGQQRLGAKALFSDGEFLARRRMRYRSDGLAVPMQLQLLEADHLDDTKTGTFGDRIVVQGVELGGFGRREAYWMFAVHPAELAIMRRRSEKSVPVPAAEVLHVFEADRIGQRRGMPALHAAMLTLRDLDDYTDAELLRKKIEACFVGVVLGRELDEEGAQSVAPTLRSADGQMVEAFEPGMMAYGEGADVKFNDPKGNTQYAAYMKERLRAVAAGAGVPYEVLAGDLEGVTYSSIKAGLIGWRRSLRAKQRTVLIHQFCRPVWAWFVEVAAMSGAVKTRNAALMAEARVARWIPPRFESPDPSREVGADISAVRAGFKSLGDVVGEYGEAVEDQLDEIARINAMLDEKGIVLQGDARQVARNSALTANDTGAAREPRASTD